MNKHLDTKNSSNDTFSANATPSFTPIRRRRHQLAISIASGFCLLLSACASSPEAERGYDTAHKIVAQIEGTSGLEQPVDRQANEGSGELRVAGNQCQRTVTTDEYGFEQELVDCGDETPDNSSNGISSAEIASEGTSVDTTTSIGSGDTPPPSGSTTSESLPTSSAGDVQTPPSTSASNRGTQRSTDQTSGPIGGSTTATSTRTTPSTTTKPRTLQVDEVLAHKGFLPMEYYPALAATAPTQALRDGFTELGQQLDLVDTYCGTDIDQWMDALSQLSSAANNVTSKTAASSSFTGSTEAKALARSIVERALHESGCANPGASSASSSKASAALARSETTVDAIVGLDNALRNSTNGPLFHQFSTYPNYLWLRNETTPTDVVLVGSSQVGAGLDVKALNQQFNLEFGSVQLPGGLAEVQQWWLPEVTKLVDPATVVWFVGPLDLFTGCNVGGRKAQYVSNHQARLKTFDRNGWLSGYDALDRIIGPRSPEETVRGDAPKRVGLDSEGLETQRTQYATDFNSFCADRARLIQQQIVELAAENRRVIVVGMPVHPELTAARQGGQAGVANEMADFAERYLAGAEFIDLTSTMQSPGPWSDLTHMTQPGSVQFTNTLIDHLYANGIR